MGDTQALDERAIEILEQYGYDIEISVSKHWDRRGFDPDYVAYRVLKDRQLMYRSEFRTEFDDPEYDRFGTLVLDNCLKLREQKDYQAQANKFDLKIAQFLKLKAEHKFSHFGEKKELKQQCEELMAYRQHFVPSKSAGIYANIPLIEENAEEMAEVIEQIREAIKTKPVQEAQPGENE